MSIENAPNINRLLQAWKKNSFKTSKELLKLGYSAQLTARYKKSKWLVCPSKGVYGLAGQTVGWEGAVYALQNGLDYPLYPGGLTALELKGYGHNLSMETRRVFLYGMSIKELPLWFRKKLSQEGGSVKTRSFLRNVQLPFLNRTFGDFDLKMSAPELAYLEMLESVPGEVGFEEASYIAENLSMLRPKVLQQLLENSSSVKINRLALYMAELHNHDWFQKLDTDKINLGSGKRVIQSGGKLDKKYNIIVPETLSEEFYVRY